jgi:hypothetical protein
MEAMVLLRSEEKSLSLWEDLVEALAVGADPYYIKLMKT